GWSTGLRDHRADSTAHALATGGRLGGGSVDRCSLRRLYGVATGVRPAPGRPRDARMYCDAQSRVGVPVRSDDAELPGRLACPRGARAGGSRLGRRSTLAQPLAATASDPAGTAPRALAAPDAAAGQSRTTATDHRGVRRPAPGRVRSGG